MIDYGTLKVWEVEDIIPLLHNKFSDEPITKREAMHYIMTYFRGHINPRVVEQAIKKWRIDL